MNHKKIIIIFSENDINGNIVDLELHPWPSLQIDLDQKGGK